MADIKAKKVLFKNRDGEHLIPYVGDTAIENRITNCLLEVPQRIKLELNNGMLILEAGSELTYGDGRTIVIENDIVGTGIVNSTLNNLILICEPQANSLGIYIQGTNATSGTTPPTIAAGVVDYIWFDTNTNQMKTSHDTQATWKEIPLPIGIVDITPYTYTNLKQVFNGFGYIGSTVWVDKGVKGLIPNGRNEDGSLRNIEFTTSNISTINLSGSAPTVISVNQNGALTSSLYYTEQEEQPTGGQTLWYKPSENIMSRINANGTLAKPFNTLVVATNDCTNGVVSNFRPKQPFRAIDYSDKSEVSGWGMPSNKYINLTLGASGTKYTAPANGWFYLNKGATRAGEYLNMESSAGYGVNITGFDGNYPKIYLPVKKGDVVTVYYSVTGSTTRFYFYYAQGEV